MAKLEYSGIDMMQWFAVFAPTRTPTEIAQRLSVDLGKVKERLAGAALEAVGGSPEQFSRRLESEGTAWFKTAHDFGLDRN